MQPVSTMTNDSSMWIEVGELSEVPQLGSRVVNTPNGDIAVFRTADDDVFALFDKCPHKGGPLSQGIVHGKTVTCPLHNWNIDMNCGMAVAPDEGCVDTYPVRIEDNKIYLSLTPNSKDGE